MRGDGGHPAPASPTASKGKGTERKLRPKDSPARVDQPLQKNQRIDTVDGVGNSISAVLAGDAAEQEQQRGLMAGRAVIEAYTMYATATSGQRRIAEGSDEEGPDAEVVALRRRVSSLEDQIQQSERKALAADAALAAAHEQHMNAVSNFRAALSAMGKKVDQLSARQSSPPPQQPADQPQPVQPNPQREGPDPNVAALTELVKQLAGLMTELLVQQQRKDPPPPLEESLPPPPPKGPQGRSTTGRPSSTWADRAKTGASRKGAKASPPPPPQEKPPIPDLAAHPSLASSFHLTGASSLQGLPQGGETLRAGAEELLRQLGAEVTVKEAYYIGRPRAGKPQRIFLRVRNPMEGQLVRLARCKLAGKGSVILDALTREELAWQRRLRGSYTDALKLGQRPQFQRARLFVTKEVKDGRMEKSEVMPPPGGPAKLG